MMNPTPSISSQKTSQPKIMQVESTLNASVNDGPSNPIMRDQIFGSTITVSPSSSAKDRCELDLLNECLCLIYDIVARASRAGIRLTGFQTESSSPSSSPSEGRSSVENENEIKYHSASSKVKINWIEILIFKDYVVGGC